MITKQCKQCKQDFETVYEAKLYCSTPCQRKYQRGHSEPKIVKVCVRDECAKEFKIHAQSDPKKYCSRSCSAKVNNVMYQKRSLEGSCLECDTPISAAVEYCESHLKIQRASGLYEKRPISRNCKNTKCQKIFITVLKNKYFCERPCYKVWSYTTHPKDKTRSLICPGCSSPKSKNAMFCKICHMVDFLQRKIDSWLNGTWKGGSDIHLSPTIRKHLLEENNYACSKCGFDTMHPVDGQTVLEINHIDGDGGNHLPANLEVLCPTCHSLTPNYRGRNVGNGRNVYYLRIAR